NTLVEGFREVELATHGPLGHSSDLILAAGVGSQHFDDFLLDEGGVHVEADQALAAAGQASTFDCDVEVQLSGELGDCLAQLHAATRTRISDGEVNLEPGDRIIGDPANRIDVRALGCQSLSNSLHVLSSDSAPKDDHDVGGHRLGCHGFRVRLDLHAHPEDL